MLSRRDSRFRSAQPLKINTRVTASTKSWLHSKVYALPHSTLYCWRYNDSSVSQSQTQLSFSQELDHKIHYNTESWFTLAQHRSAPLSRSPVIGLQSELNPIFIRSALNLWVLSENFITASANEFCKTKH